MQNRRGVRPAPIRYTLLAAAAAALALATPAAAQLASRAADEWIKTLESPNRISAMRVAEIVSALKIRKGDVIADIGAGSGALSGPLALETGPTGLLYAVDIDRDLLHHIEQRAAAQQIGNIRTVLGEFTDPKLPQQVDLAFINDVLHHIEDRATYLTRLAGYIKPGGRIAIVDFTPETSPHRAQPELVVSEAQTEAWLQAAGLKRLEKPTVFDDRFYLIYVR